MARQVALVYYTLPDLVPNGLKRVGVVGAAQDGVLAVNPTVVSSPDLAPANMPIWGAVSYASKDIVPAGLRVIGVDGGVIDSLLVNTPLANANILADGDMEAAGVTAWADYNTPTTKAKSGVQMHGGAQSLHVVTDQATEGARQVALQTYADSWYVVGGWLYLASGNAQLMHGLTGSVIYVPPSSVSGASWQYVVNVTRETATSGGRILYITGVSPAADIYADDMQLAPLVLSSLFSLAQGGSPYGQAQVAATLPMVTPAGVAMCVDSPSNPQNFVLGYHDRTNAHLVKCVGGTYTELVNQAATYGDGRVLKVVRTPGTNTWQLWYNSAQIGADQTIADAGIVSNTNHGIFNTCSGNTLAGFRWQSFLA